MSFSQIYLTMLIITNHLQCLLAHLIDHGFRRLARFFINFVTYSLLAIPNILSIHDLAYLR